MGGRAAWNIFSFILKVINYYVFCVLTGWP